MSRIDQVYIDRLLHMLCSMGISSAKAADFDEDLRRLIHVTFRSDASNVYFNDEDGIVNWPKSCEPMDIAACGCPVEYFNQYRVDKHDTSRTTTRCYNSLFKLLILLGVDNSNNDNLYFFEQNDCGAW